MRDVMQALRDGVPITLLADLVDLAAPGGPDSREVAQRETADLQWISPARLGACEA